MSTADRKSKIIDLLGAMGDYFDARRELNERMATDGGHSFDYFSASYIDACDRALERVAEAWERMEAVPFAASAESEEA